MNTKIRLVRCPRCRNVLPELAEFQVYKCGGCDAVLQAKKKRNGTVNEPDRNSDHSDRRGPTGENSSGDRKMKQVSDDQGTGDTWKQQSRVNSIGEPDQNSDHNEPCSSTELSCHEDPESSPDAAAHNRMDQDQDDDAAKKLKNGTVDPTPGRLEEHSSGKRKMEQGSDDQEAGSSSNQQLLVNTIGEPDRKIDHNEPCSLAELPCHGDLELSLETTARNRMDQDAAKKPKNGTMDATSGRLEEHSATQQEQLSDDQEGGSSLNRLSLVKSIHEPDQNSDHNEPRSSTELSCDEDPGSTPEAAADNRIEDQDQEHKEKQDQEQDMFMTNRVFKNYKSGAEFEDSSRELTTSPEKCSSSELNDVEEPSREAIGNTKGSGGGSKSSFKSLIAEKLLDMSQRRVVHRDEDDTLSEDESADLCHRRTFERISSVETLENARFGNMGYHGYEGSVSSFDGNDDQVTGKSHSKWRREMTRSDNGGHQSTGVRPFYGNTSPSRRPVNKFHENQRHRSSIIPENPKLERLELLKMVRELQDQLERTNIPSYYNHVPNHPGRYAQRMAFSGEAAAVNRSRDHSPCYHCCPQDRHFSAQLPRQLVHCNGPHYLPGAYYSPLWSGQSSPQHHPGSEFSVLARTEPKPDHHWHRNDVPKPHRSPKKRHIRPIAGGAPWIACYQCSKLLQLPQSFLVSKRRYHSLRCGSCLKVLHFTLLNGTCVARYYPEETIAAPPSSEVDDYAYSSMSRAGPVSCSDRSFQKSYSTETDKRGSLELTEERKNTTMVKDPSSSSSMISGRKKMTSEIEEIEPASSCSPLHRLMGYASPSKVIRG